MKAFIEALVSGGKHESIPEEANYFGKLVGEWTFEWQDCHSERRAQGEWLFAWILEGRAIQDVFICPSRATRETNPQPDGEYGTTIRIYNSKTKVWDITYCWQTYTARLEAKKEEGKIVMTELAYKKERWVFVEIGANHFHWQNLSLDEAGNWQVNANIYATRKA